MDIKARYTHSCKKCTFLGITQNSDLYACKDELIARYGNNDHEYRSMSSDLVERFFKPDRVDDLVIALQLNNAINS